MSEKQYADLMRAVEEAKRAAEDKGHFLIIILLIWILMK